MSILEITPTVTTSDQRTERFRSVYDESFADIDAYCRRRLDATSANDAVSEVFLTAWRRFDDMPDGSAARLWLFGVARNVIANQRRSAGRQNQLHLRLVEDHAVTRPEQAAVDGALNGPPVVEALAMLSPDDAEVLRLVAWEELSHADAGVVLGCSANAVGVRVHRARQRLADALSTLSNPASVPTIHADQNEPNS